MHVAVLQLLFKQCKLCTVIPLQFPRYNINVIMQVAVLQLIIDQYTLFTGIHVQFPRNKILPLCMWQYYSYCSINSGYLPVFPFKSPDIKLFPLNSYDIKLFNYACGSITVNYRLIHVMYRYSRSIPTK